MARSGSYDFSFNRDELIKDALIEADIINDNETPSAEMSTFSARALNRMLKHWQSHGLHLWYLKEFFVFLEKDKSKYLLGPTGDNATFSFTSTQIKVAASETDVTFDVDSTSGMTAADVILVVQDDGTLHESTIASVDDSDTVTIDDALTAAAAVDNYVYFYTSKVPRPTRIIDAALHDQSSDLDTIMDVQAGSDYWELGVKSTDGVPNLFWFDPKLDNTEVRIYPEPNDVSDYIKARGEFPLDDMDAAADDFPLPPYWYEPCLYGLAYRLAGAYRAPEDKINFLARMASSTKRDAMEYDRDTGPTYIQPEMRYGG